MLADTRSGRDPLSEISDRDMIKRLEAALGDLPPNYREVFVLHHIEDVPYEEIASMTGDSVGSLKVRAHRARKLLREAISPGAEYRRAGGQSRIEFDEKKVNTMDALFARYFDGDLNEREAREFLEAIAADPRLEKELREYERMLALGKIAPDAEGAGGLYRARDAADLSGGEKGICRGPRAGRPSGHRRQAR